MNANSSKGSGIKQALLLQAFASLLMLSPLLFLDQASFAGNSDALFYTTVLKLLSDHMAQGDLLAHWLPEANGGTGSAVMTFYCPLAYYITAIIGAPLAGNDPFGWHRLVLGMFAAQWVAGITAYIWLSRHYSHRTALLTSLLYTVFPYKFVYIFLHMNLAQLWALAWLPPLMMAAEDMAEKKLKATAWYALWTALLALTHPRTLVAFAALPALYAFLFSSDRKKIVWRLFVAQVLAVGIAAFYILPAALNLDIIKASAANLGRMYYASNLSHIDVLLNFHYAIIAVLVIGLMTRLPGLRTSRSGHEAWFYVAAIFITALLCMKISKPLWDILPPLQFLQFPAARLHVVALVAATVLAAIFSTHAKEARSPLYSPAIIWIAVAIMAGVTLHHIFDIYQTSHGITWEYIETMHRKNIILPPEYQLKYPGEPMLAGETLGIITTAVSLFFIGMLFILYSQPKPFLRRPIPQNN